MRIIIENCKVFNSNATALYIDNGKFTESFESNTADRIIDLNGKMVFPGLIDMHCHLREPGFEYRETILTGSMSAAKGGFTSICPMPNTNPVCDNAAVVSGILRKASEAN